jgi:hypothetical protein
VFDSKYFYNFWRPVTAIQAGVRESMNEIVTLAERLIPLISELRHTTENDRRIADPIVQALRQSDLCRMLLDTGAPPQYTPEEWLRVLCRFDQEAAARRGRRVGAYILRHTLRPVHGGDDDCSLKEYAGAR